MTGPIVLSLELSQIDDEDAILGTLSTAPYRKSLNNRKQTILYFDLNFRNHRYILRDISLVDEFITSITIDMAVYLPNESIMKQYTIPKYISKFSSNAKTNIIVSVYVSSG